MSEFAVIINSNMITLLLVNKPKCLQPTDFDATAFGTKNYTHPRVITE